MPASNLTKRVPNDNDVPAEIQAIAKADIHTDVETMAKAIAVGVYMAGIQLLELDRGPARANAPCDVLTADEVAELLRLDRKTVYDYAARGEIPCQRLGKRMLFSRAAIMTWLGANVAACSKGSSNGGSI
jgi:excisionase family DNA binding protein